MNLELAGQVAVVLGAASGIGRAIAQAFIQEGAKVALLDRVASITDVAQQMEQIQAHKSAGRPSIQVNG